MTDMNKTTTKTQSGVSYGSHARKSKNPFKNVYLSVAHGVSRKTTPSVRGKHTAVELHRERLALLIDVENIGLRNVDKVMCEAGQFGKLAIRYAYGVHAEALGNENVVKQALEPRFVVQIRKGKNASDIAIAADAMSLCYTRDDIDGFVIVSDDSDYAALALSLRNLGKTVYGVGTESAPQGYRDVCTGFRTFVKRSGSAKKKANSKKKIINDYSPTVVNSRVREFVIGWLKSDNRQLTIGDVANFMNKTKDIPTAKQMGFSKVSSYVVNIGCTIGAEQKILSID